MSEPVDIFGLAAHPADVFPMMSEAGLKELGADIETRGQQEPIIISQVNGTMLLIDRRNRREACRLAGLTPFRRHMTQGQMAMCAAVVGGAS